MNSNVLRIVAVYVCIIVSALGFGLLITNMVTEEIQQKRVHAAQWSRWSDPEVVRPCPPFPQWFIQQCQTNLATGEIRARIITHGTPSDGIYETGKVIAN
jgi:hypothetical protein